MARVGEEFPFACSNCGGDIRLIAFITEPGPIRKTLTHLGEPLEPPPVSPARGPPTDWGELVQVHDDRNVFQATDRRAARDRYPQPLTPAERQFTTKPSAGRTRRDSAPTPEKFHFGGGKQAFREPVLGPTRREHAAYESLISRPMLAEVPLAGLSSIVDSVRTGHSVTAVSTAQLSSRIGLIGHHAAPISTKKPGIRYKRKSFLARALRT